MVQQVSDKFPAYIKSVEGPGSRAYRDSGGVWTIGNGLTMLDPIFAAYWMRTRGHALRAGDTITDEENAMLIKQVVAGGYGKDVVKKFGDKLTAHGFDGVTSSVFNFGPGGLKWTWATMLAAGDVAGACVRLRQTALTAITGQFLPGLVNRRKRDTAVIEKADYGLPDMWETVDVDGIKGVQGQLSTLGYYKGDTHGIKDSATSVAIKDFQEAEKLKVDGRVGPATRAALLRASTKQRAVTVGASGTAVGAGAGAATDMHNGVDWGTAITGGKWALAVAVVSVIAFAVYSNRGSIIGTRSPV